MPTKMELSLEQTQQGVSYEVSFSQWKMEILLEHTINQAMVEHAEYDESNTYVLERFNTTAGNPVKKILLKLNLSDHRLFKDGGGVKEVQRSFRHSDTERLSRSDEVLKLKNFKKDATLKLFKSTNQVRYEHVGPEVASPQDGKVTRWRRDYAWLMISRCSRSQCQIQVQGTSSIQKSMITTTYSQEKVKNTFYNALNANDQDSLNSATGGNFLDKMPRECLRIIESKSKVRNSRNKAVVAKVSSNSSTPEISPDVAALTTEVSKLKNMMKTMLIEKQKA
ncbi:hypothetical protein Tco_1360122 [Tanacetum coccineum]